MSLSGSLAKALDSNQEEQESRFYLIILYYIILYSIIPYMLLVYLNLI